ncbi:secretin N-terminal domain-containing protein [Gilliamella sp. ESL0443]|uniref:secretin N-terminal domain-containing protein n=1 Tax=Gilliamella sp. ESL0443 TaxID=2704655 RepID=UPI001C69981D|nr:secretin N-terminal domain-containing protein [Gilliamella sp. ESL0443]QYN42465.1 type IV pilus secretin PilQ [Gilliamella sp. ESL0443]
MNQASQLFSQLVSQLAKNLRQLTILLMLLSIPCLAEPSISAKKESNDLISMNFYQTDVAIILQALADNKQMNLVIIDDISTKQTIKLKNVDWQKALKVVLNSANLQAEIEDNILFVSKSIEPEVLAQRELLEQKEQELNQPLTLLTIPIKHGDPNNLVETIQQQGLLSERGKAIVDKRTNSVLITDMTKQFADIKKLVKALDQPIPQVHISAHIVTMSDESMEELGIKWGYLGKSSQFFNQLDVDLGVVNPSSSAGFNLAKLSGSLLNLELSALESENQLEIIASPNLLTANQNMASIKQGTEIPYEVSTGGNGSTSIEFKQAVLGLKVTPKIVADKQMILDLYITQNTTGRSIKRRDGGEALAIETQEIKTQVKVKDGETVVLGGIFQQVNSNGKKKVPGLAQVPIIGNAFKYNAKKNQKRELVIFITPQLVE